MVTFTQELVLDSGISVSRVGYLDGVIENTSGTMVGRLSLVSDWFFASMPIAHTRLGSYRFMWKSNSSIYPHLDRSSVLDEG